MSRVYVGRLSYQAREKDVERFFRGFGRIRDINLKNGFGFVEFEDPRDADDAVYELNGRELLGERVIVEHARGGSGYGRSGGGGGGGGYRGSGGGGGGGGRGAPTWLTKYGPPTRTDYRIIVENISSRVSWQDLKDFMRQAGEITFADAHKQRVGEGIVEYASYDDMRTAMRKLDGIELKGRRLRLIEDYKGSRRRSRSRSRSRSRGRRSRSRSPRSHSRSQRSRSHSRDRDRRNRRSHSRDSPARERTRSRSRSASKERNHRGRSRSRSGSRDSREREESPHRSPVARNSSKSRSASPAAGRERSNSPPQRSPSPQKSPPREAEMNSRSASPAQNED